MIPDKLPNSVNPDQTAFRSSLIKVYTVYQDLSDRMFKIIHYSIQTFELDNMNVKIFNGWEVLMENSVTRVIVSHYSHVIQLQWLTDISLQTKHTLFICPTWDSYI